MENEDEGFTLVELVVAMMLIGLVAALAAALTGQGMTATRDTQQRVSLSQELQRETERLARDLRVADPLRATGAGNVVLDLHRGDTCVRRTYSVASAQLTVSSSTFAGWPCPSYPTPASATPTDVSSGVLLSGVTTAAAPLFSYTGAASQVLPAPAPALVRAVTITLSATAAGGAAPLSLRTTVGVRNAALS